MFQTLAWLSAQIRGAQVSAKIATKSNLRRSWYDYNWDWALILLLAFVLLAGIVVLWTYADHPQTAAAVDLLALSWGGLMTTVLVVEDEILVRLAICEDLAVEGYEVLTADNADQAPALHRPQQQPRQSDSLSRSIV